MIDYFDDKALAKMVADKLKEKQNVKHNKKINYAKTRLEELCMMPEMKCDIYCKYSRKCK